MSEQQHKRERIAYEELQVGDPIMDGDEWQNNDGRWQLFSVAPIQVLQGSRVRRPYKISAILEIGDALTDAQKAARQRQSERDNALAALKSAQRARDELQRQVDELRAERSDEPTARQVRDMLRTWLTELDWSIGCFGSFGRSQIDIIEQTMVTVINRISSMINPEGGTDDN